MPVVGHHDFQGGVDRPASDAEVEAVKARFGHPLPSDYLEALQKLNGWRGFVGPIGADGDDVDARVYLALYPAVELHAVNEDYEVPEHEPTMLLVGTSEGGEAILLSRPTETTPVAPWILLPFADIGERNPARRIERRFPSFAALIDGFIAELAEIDLPDFV